MLRNLSLILSKKYKWHSIQKKWVVWKWSFKGWRLSFKLVSQSALFDLKGLKENHVIYAKRLPGHDQNGRNGYYMIELVESVLKMGCPIEGYLMSFHKQIKLK